MHAWSKRGVLWELLTQFGTTSVSEDFPQQAMTELNLERQMYKRENTEWREGHSRHREQPLHIREGAQQIGRSAGLSKCLGSRVCGNGWEWPERKGESWFQPDTHAGPWMLCHGTLEARVPFHRSASWKDITCHLSISLLPLHVFPAGLICSQIGWRARFSITGITAVGVPPITYWTRGLGSPTTWKATPHR